MIMSFIVSQILGYSDNLHSAARFTSQIINNLIRFQFAVSLCRKEFIVKP